MSILNAFSILGAGVGKGYRASEAASRALAEARRKALLEEREQTMREAANVSRIALEGAQAGEASARTGEITERTTSEREGRERKSRRFGSLNLDVLGNKLELPDMSYGDAESMSPLLESLLREAGNTAEMNARISNPTVFGGSRKPYMTAEEEAMADIADRRIQALRVDPLILATNPDAMVAYNREVERILDEELPDRLRQLRRKNRSSVQSPQDRFKGR